MDGVLSGLDNLTQTTLLRSLLGSSGLLRDQQVAVLLTTSQGKEQTALLDFR